jgi:hypothetical protein
MVEMRVNTPRRAVRGKFVVVRSARLGGGVVASFRSLARAASACRKFNRRWAAVGPLVGPCAPSGVVTALADCGQNYGGAPYWGPP